MKKIEFHVLIVAIATTVVFWGALEISVHQVPLENATVAQYLAQQKPDSEGSIKRTDVTLHYTVYGKQGPVLVMLSGGPGGEVDYLKPTALHLRNRYRVVMLEQRGTGRSMLAEYSERTLSVPIYIDDLESLRLELRRTLGVQKITPIGNSWGMMLALAYAGTHPDSVDKVVTMGSGPISPEYYKEMLGITLSRLTSWQRMRHNYALIRGRKDAAILALQPAYFYDQSKMSALSFTLTPIKPVVNRKVFDHLNWQETDLRPLMAKITAPTLIIQGEHDIVSPRMVTEIKAIMLHANIETPPRIGHTPFSEDPIWTFAKLDAFLSHVK
jgi:proline iminopeptidase